MGQKTTIDSIIPPVSESFVQHTKDSSTDPYVINFEKTDSIFGNTLNNKNLHIPHGSISCSQRFNRNPYEQEPYCFSLDGSVSQAMLSIPLIMNAGITEYGTVDRQIQTNFSLSFDRTLFIQQMRKWLEERQREKFKNSFDSVHELITKLNSFDSIRNLVNNVEVIAQVNNAYKFIDSIEKSNKDSMHISDIEIDSTCFGVSKAVIKNYETLQHYYNQLLSFQKKVLSEYHTLDHSEIAKTFHLPLEPAHLNEDQLLEQAEKYGIDQLNKFVSGVKEFTIGQTLLNQSPLTLSNRIVNGCLISYAMKSLYFKSVLARERMNENSQLANKATSSQPFGSPKQFTIISQGLIGASRQQKEFAEISLTGFKLSDQQSPSAITPFKNSLLCLSAGFEDENGFRARLEISTSSNSYFTDGQQETTNTKTRASQHLGYHFQLEKEIYKSGSAIKLEYLSASPLYKTFGNSLLASDSRSIKGSFIQTAFNHKLRFSSNFNCIQYNVTSFYQLPFYQFNYDAELHYNIRSSALSVRYHPFYFTSPGESERNIQKMIQFQFSNTFLIGKRKMSTMICAYAHADENSNDTLNFKQASVKMLRCDLQQQVCFSPEFSVQALASIQAQAGNVMQPNYYLVGLNGNWHFGENGMIAFNFSIQAIAEERSYMGGTSAAWKIRKNASINFYGDLTFANSFINENNVLSYRSSVSYTQSF